MATTRNKNKTMDTSCRLLVGFPRQRCNGSHSSTLWHSQEQRHFRAHSCAPWHMAIRDKGNMVRGRGGSHSLCSAPPRPKQQKTMTNPQKLHLPIQAMSLLCCLLCSFTASPCWRPVPQAVAPFLLLCCTPLSSAPVGWAPFSWTGVTPAAHSQLALPSNTHQFAFHRFPFSTTSPDCVMEKSTERPAGQQRDSQIHIHRGQSQHSDCQREKEAK